uniref:Uncharacterized protein n=1 Tax=viral metagenome TaxID=1070528 RepID=A0A6C0IVN9_9ZZZZ
MYIFNIYKYILNFTIKNKYILIFINAIFTG